MSSRANVPLVPFSVVRVGTREPPRQSPGVLGSSLLGTQKLPARREWLCDVYIASGSRTFSNPTGVRLLRRVKVTDESRLDKLWKAASQEVGDLERDMWVMYTYNSRWIPGLSEIGPLLPDSEMSITGAVGRDRAVLLVSSMLPPPSQCGVLHTLLSCFISSPKLS